VRRVFISYSHDSEKHKERVHALGDRLRNDGVTVILDRDMLPGGRLW
jgi:TIR domain